jgi:hypothetical protein
VAGPAQYRRPPGIRTAAAVATPEVDLTLTNIITVQFTADELFVLRHLAGRTGPVTPDELDGYLPWPTRSAMSGRTPS